ncbi:hypothetical protein Ancab_013787 [Ancistrocladus abbreviatus]
MEKLRLLDEMFSLDRKSTGAISWGGAAWEHATFGRCAFVFQPFPGFLVFSRAVVSVKAGAVELPAGNGSTVNVTRPKPEWPKCPVIAIVNVTASKDNNFKNFNC